MYIRWTDVVQTDALLGCHMSDDDGESYGAILALLLEKQHLYTLV